MKIKLASFLIFLICLACVVSAGLLSVHRSEGRVLTEEMQAKIEAFLEQHGVELPELPKLPELPEFPLK